MMKIALAMITTDRSQQKRRNYIFDTLIQMETSGIFRSPYFHSLTIHVDGPQIQYAKQIQQHSSHFPNVRVVTYDTTAGSAGNAMRAHRALSQLDDVNWVMILEDDLMFSLDFLSRTIEWLHKAYDAKRYIYQIGVWSNYVDAFGKDSKEPWFDFYGHEEPGKKIYTKEKPTSLMRGSQCYIMKKEHSTELADFIEKTMKKEKVTKLVHHDMRLRHWLNEKAIEEQNNEVAFVRAPRPHTYVQHVGKESAVYNVKKHIDPSFYFSASR